jgi:hypothetical protein
MGPHIVMLCTIVSVIVLSGSEVSLSVCVAPNLPMVVTQKPQDYYTWLNCFVLGFRLFVCFLSARAWTQDLILVKQVLYHLCHTPAFFALVIFQIGSQVFVWGQPCNCPIYASHVAGMTGASHHPWLFCWDGVLLTFCLGWPQSTILTISTSHVAGMIGMSYCSWPDSVLSCYLHYILDGERRLVKNPASSQSGRGQAEVEAWALSPHRTPVVLGSLGW